MAVTFNYDMMTYSTKPVFIPLGGGQQKSRRGGLPFHVVGRVIPLAQAA